MMEMVRYFRLRHRPNRRLGSRVPPSRIDSRRGISLAALTILFVAFTALEMAAPVQRLAPPPVPPAVDPVTQEPPQIQEQPTEILTPKQKQNLLKSNFEKMRRDVDDLAALAKSLQQDVDKSNEHVLSLKVVEKAEKIEKLARRIKDAAKGA